MTDAAPTNAGLAVSQIPDEVLARFGTDGWGQLDAFEDLVERVNPAAKQGAPLRHIFTPGLYSREIFMPAGKVFTTRIHLREHPFVLLKGRVSVWSDETGWVQITAPFVGITPVGTRRALYTHEDSVWLTFHVSEQTDPDAVVREVTFSEGKYADLGFAAAKPEDLIYRSPALLQ